MPVSSISGSKRCRVRPSLRRWCSRESRERVKLLFGFRAVLAAHGLAIAVACAGCAAGAIGMVSTVAPMVAAGSAQVIGSQVAMRDANSTVSKDDDSDRCDQLLRVPTGIEEIRKTKDGVIESRQWKIVQSAGSPVWMLAAQKSTPENAWKPKPNIARLNFNPPIFEMIAPGKPQFMAYAPAEVVNPSDSEQFDQ